MRKTALLLPAAAGLALLFAGCFDVEESVSLNRDLSGKGSFHMTIDMDAMVPFIAGMQHSMTGAPGSAPTQAELDAVRAQMLAKNDAKASTLHQDEAAEKAKLERSLPAGVKLLSSSVDEQGLKIAARIDFGFDDVRKLAQISLPEKGSGSGSGAAGTGAAAPGSNPYAQPWSGLKIVDEGPTLLLTMTGVDPAARIKGQADYASTPPEVQKQIAALIGTARFAFRLDSPFDVVETNATRRDGRTLYWEVKLTDPNAVAPQMLMARLKK